MMLFGVFKIPLIISGRFHPSLFIHSIIFFPFSQKQFIFEYALAICSMNNDQALYRLQALIQYQHDKLGYTDLELLAYLERTCVENQPIQAAQVYTLFEIYRMIKVPLKSKRYRERRIIEECLVVVAQIMYHYGCSINDLKEQKKVFELALNALGSMEKTPDPTDRLFLYPINSEYNVKISILSLFSLIVFLLVNMSIKSKFNAINRY